MSRIRFAPRCAALRRSCAPPPIVAYYATRARLAMSQHDRDGADAALGEGHESAARHDFQRLENALLHEDMRCAVADGDLGVARRLLHSIDDADLQRALTPGPHTTTRDEPLAMAWARARVVHWANLPKRRGYCGAGSPSPATAAR